MKRAKVAELKAHLSGYLAEVRGGASFIVCDRNTPIATLSPYDHTADLLIREAQDPAASLRSIRGIAIAGPDAPLANRFV